MKVSDLKGRKGGGLKMFSRKTVSVSTEHLIKTSSLHQGQSLPLVVQPAVEGVDLIEWARNNHEFIDGQLDKHGGLLFRHFDVAGMTGFEQFAQAASNELLDYQERSSPRSRLSGNVYTSTDYPAGQRIFLHNENSYQHVFPLKIFFFCITPPESGGETPIADCRRVLQRIAPEIQARFKDKAEWMLVRNFRDDLGISWQTAFQTTDKAQVEQYCRRADILTEWEDDRLRTCQIRPVIATHPRTGEKVWFNHATFFHVSTLDPAVHQALLAQYEVEELPGNTYYGDGSAIEPAVMDELREAYLQETVRFPWQSGDILMLDNMLVAHGREAFTGQRKIVVAMADPFSRTG